MRSLKLRVARTVAQESRAMTESSFSHFKASSITQLLCSSDWPLCSNYSCQFYVTDSTQVQPSSSTYPNRHTSSLKTDLLHKIASRQVPWLSFQWDLSQWSPPKEQKLELIQFPFFHFNKRRCGLLSSCPMADVWKWIGNFEKFISSLCVSVLSICKTGSAVLCLVCKSVCGEVSRVSDYRTCCRWMCYGGMLNIKARCHFLSLCICSL